MTQPNELTTQQLAQRYALTALEMARGMVCNADQEPRERYAPCAVGNFVLAMNQLVDSLPNGWKQAFEPVRTPPAENVADMIEYLNPQYLKMGKYTGDYEDRVSFVKACEIVDLNDFHRDSKSAFDHLEQALTYKSGGQQ